MSFAGQILQFLWSLKYMKYTKPVKKVFEIFLFLKSIYCKWNRSKNFCFVPKFASNMIFKYANGVMIISYVILKGLKKEILFASLRPTKPLLSLNDNCSLVPSYGETFWDIRLVWGHKELSQKLCSLSEEDFPKIDSAVYRRIISISFCVCVYVVLIFRDLGRNYESVVIKD